MTPERWQQIKAIAADALDREAGERAAFVAGACGTDDELRGEVLSLLAAEDPSGTFLELERPPDRVGAWKIVKEVGRGGMGTVYLAERADGQFEQRVAVKIITRGMDSAAIVRRFHAERRMLARLDHPHIARLIDGGVTEDGRPYFVMEFVEGVPFVTHCRQQHLPPAGRLALFATLLEAVEHAHRHLILHRDIKSENVLVDQRGNLKLVDFGIARLLDSDGQPGSQPTEPGFRAMTPQCSSPEQVRGESLTTASDVYALGLLLYETLTDRSAYDLAGLPFTEQVRVVCEQQPPRPSDTAAGGRRLRGDLDNIVMKAIDKEPARRYARAADMAADLQRFSSGRPVAARPASLAYRARKYAARHWRGLAVASAVTIIVAAAITNAIVQGQRAQRRFEDVRALATSFIFEFHDAIAKLPGSTPARELVVSRALQYLDGLAKEASGDLSLTKELAQSYQRVGDAQGLYFESNLGQTSRARESYEKAVALFTTVANADPSNLRAKADLAQAILKVSTTFQEHDPKRARELMLRVQSMLPDDSAPASMDPSLRLASGMVHIGLAENPLSSPQETLEHRNRSIEIFRAAVEADPGHDDAARWLSMSFKRRAALYLGPLKDPERGLADLKVAAATDEARLARDPGNAVAQLDLALGEGYRSAALRRMGDLPGAIAALNHAMVIRKRILDADPRNVRVAEQLTGDYTRLAGLEKELAAVNARVH